MRIVFFRDHLSDPSSNVFIFVFIFFFCLSVYYQMYAIDEEPAILSVLKVLTCQTRSSIHNIASAAHSCVYFCRGHSIERNLYNAIALLYCIESWLTRIYGINRLLIFICLAWYHITNVVLVLKYRFKKDVNIAQGAAVNGKNVLLNSSLKLHQHAFFYNGSCYCWISIQVIQGFPLRKFLWLHHLPKTSQLGYTLAKVCSVFIILLQALYFVFNEMFRIPLGQTKILIYQDMINQLATVIRKQLHNNIWVSVWEIQRCFLAIYPAQKPTRRKNK